jgi:glycogen debranching enzyme
MKRKGKSTMNKHTETSAKRSGFWSGALFGIFTGMASLLSYQYLRGILRKPRLISKAVFSDDERFENKDEMAMFIAAENLRSGIQSRHLSPEISKEILHAGYRNFRESWARDFSFASYGLLAVEQFKTVKETLEAFFWHQTRKGQFPIKLHSINVVTRFFYSLFGREQPTELKLKPKYISGHGTPSLDGQSLLIITALNYVQEAEDTTFLRVYWDVLKSAMIWLEGYCKDPQDRLLYQEAYADWADSIARSGAVLYTNVVYWKALTEMAQAAQRLGQEEDAALYNRDAEHLSRAIQRRLWQPELGYFVTSTELDQFSSAGNLLAIAWGLAYPEQAESILTFMDEAKLSEPVPTRVSYPAYPKDLVATENRLSGVGNYHTDASWLWIGAWHVIALAQTDHMEQARQVLESITDTVVRDRQVNEVHGPDGLPLRSILYKSEAPLTWNAGMILYAYQIYKRHSAIETNILSMLEGAMA